MDYKNMFSLEGRTALVTGASRGIGREIARVFAQYGANVVLAGRKLEGLQETADIIAKDGGKAEPIVTHMGKSEDIEKLIGTIEEKYNKLDVLVHNAATNPFFGPLVEADQSVWDKTFDVNLKGPFFLTQKAVPLLKKSKSGAVIAISSINGVSPPAFQGIYSMTKAAIIAMTKAYAKELAGINVRVNAILPGLTKTKFASALVDDDKQLAMILPQIPMGRVAIPEELAGCALYLATDASSYVTGSCFSVDGGFLS